MRLEREAFDKVFLQILDSQVSAALKEAASCTQAVLELSAQYLDQPAFETLQQFHDLYFSKTNDEQKAALNDEVSDMVSQLQAQLEAGEDLTILEDEDKKQRRLSLSAVQKKLESLITLDGGIRDQVLPALASMQCEDEIRQRVNHIVGAWEAFMSLLSGKRTDAGAVMREVAGTLTSVDETKEFYRIVLGEDPPAGLDSRSTFLEF